MLKLIPIDSNSRKVYKLVCNVTVLDFELVIMLEAEWIDNWLYKRKWWWMREAILNLYTNWITLGMLQYLSCLFVGQFGEIVFSKICFNEVVTMSD